MHKHQSTNIEIDHETALNKINEALANLRQIINLTSTMRDCVDENASKWSTLKPTHMSVYALHFTYSIMNQTSSGGMAPKTDVVVEELPVAKQIELAYAHWLDLYLVVYQARADLAKLDHKDLAGLLDEIRALETSLRMHRKSIPNWKKKFGNSSKLMAKKVETCV